MQSLTDEEILALLAYSGTSSQTAKEPEPGRLILDYRNTDANLRSIDALLSARGIAFHLKRPSTGWSHTRVRLSLTVAEESLQEALMLLDAAVRVGALEMATGLEGLVQ